MVDETIPRRDFLKGAVVGTAAIATGQTPAVAQTTAAPAATSAVEVWPVADGATVPPGAVHAVEVVQLVWFQVAPVTVPPQACPTVYQYVSSPTPFPWTHG